MNELPFNQLLVSSLNNKEKKLHAEPFSYQSLFLSSITPDPSNARFMPAILIEDEHAKMFVNRSMTKQQLSKIYHAENHVMVGKSCIINCLKYGSHDWKKANQTIESILELGDNISASELIQVPTIYPISENKYCVLTGHRRFFALVYANGYGSASQFKLYNTKPLLVKVKQFQENASREDLPQYGKLTAFLSAITEIEALNSARIRVGLKKMTVKETATSLGVSMGAFDNYNVLTRYPCILDFYKSEFSQPFIKTKKIVLEVESGYKLKFDKKVLGARDKSNINDEIKCRLIGKKRTAPEVSSFKVKPIKSAQTIKSLLTANIMELDTGVDWENIDWDDHLDVSNTLATVIEFLESN